MSILYIRCKLRQQLQAKISNSYAYTYMDEWITFVEHILRCPLDTHPVFRISHLPLSENFY